MVGRHLGEEDFDQIVRVGFWLNQVDDVLDIKLDNANTDTEVQKRSPRWEK